VAFGGRHLTSRWSGRQGLRPAAAQLPGVRCLLRRVMNQAFLRGVLAPVTVCVFACGQAPSASQNDSWPLACAFIPVQESTDEVAQCARRDPSGDIVVRPEVAAEHSPPGVVSSIVVDDLLLYVLSSGKTAPALWFDNGADRFVEGLARTVRSGRVGFVDKELVEIIPPRWDFAFRFESGFAVVCNGCKSEPVGEHEEMVGGEWGYIDSQGAVVVPLIHSRDELPSRDLLEAE
jgi:hypothetical protein